MEQAQTRTFLVSTIGKKVVMALTGIVLFGFVIGHMLGNLQLYLGAEALNAYGHSLHTMLHGGGLWAVRTVLLLALGLHVWAMVSLRGLNAQARQARYKVYQPRKSTYASRAMYVTGPVLFLFIVYHLLHFTTGQAHPHFVTGEVYANVVSGFQVPLAALAYIVSMGALGFHLWHGVWSLMHTVGFAHPRYNALRHGAASFLTALVVVGNLSFPLSVLLGFVK